MGSLRASSLPICLISDLQRKVNEVYFPGRPLGSVGFWMDTLCVPVHDPELRKISIASMRHIYSSASAVLVLERTIQETHSDSSIYSRSLTLYSSKWLRRLWTYHEGGLARRVYFQFRDRSEDLKAILSQAHEQRRYDLSQGLLSNPHPLLRLSLNPSPAAIFISYAHLFVGDTNDLLPITFFVSITTKIALGVLGPCNIPT